MRIRVHNTIHDIVQADWDSCALHIKTDLNPFCSYGRTFEKAFGMEEIDFLTKEMALEKIDALKADFGY